MFVGGLYTGLCLCFVKNRLVFVVCYTQVMFVGFYTQACVCGFL